MIDLFLRELRVDAPFHPRVRVVRLQDYEQAAFVASVVPPSDTDVPLVGARPARTRASVAKLVERRDLALDRELRSKGLLPTAAVLHMPRRSP